MTDTNKKYYTKEPLLIALVICFGALGIYYEPIFYFLSGYFLRMLQVKVIYG